MTIFGLVVSHFKCVVCPVVNEILQVKIRYTQEFVQNNNMNTAISK